MIVHNITMDSINLYFPFVERKTYSEVDRQKTIFLDMRDLIKQPGNIKPTKIGLYFREENPLDQDCFIATKWNGSVWLSLNEEYEHDQQELPWYAQKNDPAKRHFAIQYGRVIK